jgi:1-phosphofructokinase family hexose kinase
VGDFTLHVVCPNPALDRIQVVPEFEPFAVNRVSSVQSLAGGKGMIVCRGARRLGASVTAHGYVGGAVGEMIRAGCRELGVVDRHLSIDGETRITPVVIDESSGRSTVLNERGPDVTGADEGRLLDRLAADVRAGDVVVATGSLPPGTSTDLYARIARLAQSAGAIVLVDAHGPALAAVIDDLRTAPGATVLKPNLEELSDVLDITIDPDDVPAIDRELVRLVSATGASVVVTRGPHGAVWRDPDGMFVVGSPEVETRNATGSGDSFLAGLAVALGRGEAAEDALRLAAAMGAANAASVLPDVDVRLVRSLVDTVVVEIGGASP